MFCFAFGRRKAFRKLLKLLYRRYVSRFERQPNVMGIGGKLIEVDDNALVKL